MVIKVKNSLRRKFLLVTLFLGLIPMFTLTIMQINQMVDRYQEILIEDYTRLTEILGRNLENMFDSYNTISKMIYRYDSDLEGNVSFRLNSGDNFRRLIDGVDVSTNGRSLEVELFMRNLHASDAYINSIHFLGYTSFGEEFTAHFSYFYTYFRSLEVFKASMGYDNWDTESNQLIIIPAHQMSYYRSHQTVFTVARNYFDIRENIGENRYIGTIFIDVNMNRVENILNTLRINRNDQIYLYFDDGRIFHSTSGYAYLPELNDSNITLDYRIDNYGLNVLVVLDEHDLFHEISLFRNNMLMILSFFLVGLMVFGFFCIKKLMKPLHLMMEEMKKVEKGDFNINLPVNTKDEIGVLSERFNQMSLALDLHINHYYRAKIKQTEAELTTLKSQIYPHFLYNTLEIIRMTAMDKDEQETANMIEALGEQIHYVIGPLGDMVPLREEVNIVQKYVSLLNYRIHGMINFTVNINGISDFLVPKLILQPLVENAYLHGLKAKKMGGHILIKAKICPEYVEISVIDNGIGMSAETVVKVEEMLKGEEMGIKNGSYRQSIGLKNIHDRIRFLYGEAYGIKVLSTPQIGTIVSILIPISKEEC